APARGARPHRQGAGRRAGGGAAVAEDRGAPLFVRNSGSASGAPPRPHEGARVVAFAAAAGSAYGSAARGSPRPPDRGAAGDRGRRRPRDAPLAGFVPPLYHPRPAAVHAQPLRPPPRLGPS